MATRFYLPRWDGRAGAVSPAFGSLWAQTTNAFRRLLATTKGATTPTSTTSGDFTKTGSTSNWDVAQFQFTSDTLDVAQTITGTWSGVLRLGETAAAADLSLQATLRVVSLDGTVERGVLYAGHAAALNATAGALGQEAGTTAATRLIPAGTALSSVAAQPGDRIVLEVGTRSHVATTGQGAFIQFGDNSATADHDLTAGATTSLVPWVELSQTLTFGTPQIALTPTTSTWAAIAVSPVPGPVDVTVTPAVTMWSAVAVSATPQPVTVVLTPAAIAWSAVPVSLDLPPSEVTLTPASTSWTAVAVTAAPPSIDVVLTPAATSWSAVPLSPAPQPVTVVLTPAATTWSAVPVTPVTTVVQRPFTGVTARPSSGSTPRPYAGTTARP